MKLALDYFLLYHGINIEHDEPIALRKDSADYIDIAALVLATTRNSFEKFIPLSTFNNLLNQISDKKISHLDELNHLQLSIVIDLQNSNDHFEIEQLHHAFEYLRKQNILANSDFDKLVSLFEVSEIITIPNCDDGEIVDGDEPKTFKESKSNILDVLSTLKELVDDDYLPELNETLQYIDNQKFSIGITGVMNAGKSTMLNALMGQEILGSAVVPETANLTIVKYDKNPSAKVFYWNKKEWNRIQSTANEISSIKDFINETKSIFGNDLDKYILDESRFDDVDINNLAQYTSAEASGKKCNIVKYVELRSDLEFLSDGIEIVDTPGLDDPVIQREEITKEYVSQCDLMIHLMNVSQSATLKDVEFIIDALLYQNISKLLVVITRADTVTKEQLQEVINYTKSSIERQLKAINKGSKLDYILKTIKFIPISGKMALYHRTGREAEALKAGYKIEDTGILEIENYLMDTLFGKESSKSDLIIQGAKSQIHRIVEKATNSLNYQLRLLSKSKDELEKELIEFNKKKTINESIFLAMKEDINYYKNDAKNYIGSLEAFLTSELIDLQNIIKQRVVSDVRYSFEKTKKKPENSRTRTIIETAIKDGIIDVIRDYRYKFIKKSQNIGEICEQKYQDFGFSMGHKNDNFDARGFFQDDFKSGFLISSNEVLISKILNEVSSSKANKIEQLDTSIQTHLKDEFVHIESTIKEKAEKVSVTLIESFFDTLNAPIKRFEQKLSNDERLLQNQISSFEANDKNKDALSLEIHKKLRKLDSIVKGCKS